MVSDDMLRYQLRNPILDVRSCKSILTKVIIDQENK